MDYVENPNAPTFRAHGLHDLDFISGTDGLFTLFHFKKTEGGIWYKETVLFVEVPIPAIPPAITLTTRKMGMAVISPIKDAVARVMRIH